LILGVSKLSLELFNAFRIMLNKIMAVLFIFIMTIPFLPVSNGTDSDIAIQQQMTEDLQETTSNMIEEEAKLFAAYLHYSYPGIDTPLIFRVMHSFFSYDEPLYKWYHLQVLEMPPNC